MRLLEKEKADDKAKDNNTRADKIREQERVRLEDGALEEFKGLGGTGEQSAKSSSDDGATKGGQSGAKRSVQGRNSPDAPNKWHYGISARCFTLASGPRLIRLKSNQTYVGASPP